MTQPPPSPPPALRPWFYQTWFLIPAFILGWPFVAGLTHLPIILWPAWGVLIIRSPWHNTMLFRAPAWAMLLAGGGMMVQMFQAAPRTQDAFIVMIPGLILTVTTQILWTKYKLEAAAGSQPPTSPAAPVELPSTASRRPRPRRRVHRRRGSRPGRSPRRPG